MNSMSRRIVRGLLLVLVFVFAPVIAATSTDRRAEPAPTEMGVQRSYLQGTGLRPTVFGGAARGVGIRIGIRIRITSRTQAEDGGLAEGRRSARPPVCTSPPSTKLRAGLPPFGGTS